MRHFAWSLSELGAHGVEWLVNGFRARLLAGEANVPGTCPKRSANFIAVQRAPSTTSARVPQNRPPSALLGFSPALLQTVR